MHKNTATLELNNNLDGRNRNFLVYQRGSNVIVSAVSPFLVDIAGAVNFDEDTGILTFLAVNSKTGETVEDYWDLYLELESLGITDKKADYFGGLKTEDIVIKRKADAVV